MEIKDIFLIILLASGSALCIALIIYLKKIIGSINRIEGAVNNLMLRVDPILNQTNQLMDKVNFITEQAKSPVQDAREIVDEVKERVDMILGLEENIRTGVVNNYNKISNAIKAFVHTYKRPSRRVTVIR